MRYIIILLALISFTASAQSAVVGTWNVNWTSMRAAMSASENEKFSKMSAPVQARAQQSFETRSFQFGSDGQFTANWTNDGSQSATGTWSEANGTITIVAQGQTKIYNYSIAGGNQLTLTDSSTGGMFSTIILNKAN